MAVDVAVAVAVAVAAPAAVAVAVSVVGADGSENAQSVAAVEPYVLTSADSLPQDSGATVRIAAAAKGTAASAVEDDMREN